MERAHSIVTIKKIDTDSRTIRGLATSPAPDRMGDVVDPSGAQFKLPIPLLYQHRHDEPLGEVTAARVGSASLKVKS